MFSKMISVDFKDAHLIKAECFFRFGEDDLENAHDEINYLCSLLGLDPLPNPSGMSGDEYELLMAETLDELSDLID